MYINPFPFGIFIGVIGTIVSEILSLVIIANRGKGDDE